MLDERRRGVGLAAGRISMLFGRITKATSKETIARLPLEDGQTLLLRPKPGPLSVAAVIRVTNSKRP